MQQLQKSPQDFLAGVKDMDPKQGIVMGYLSAFNNMDSDNDIILPGAFTKTIMEMGPESPKPRIRYYLDHNPSKALGVFTVLKEDTKGLYYEAKVGDHALGQDFIKMVESGLITEHSIGYGVVRKTVTNPDADWHEQITHLQELKLWEGSALQCHAANPDTPLVGLKMRQRAESRIPALIKAIRSGAFRDETFELLEKELLFLQQAIKTDSTTDTTLPEHTDATTTPGNEEKGLINTLSLMNLKVRTALSIN
jgi:HK97 family phage prohead protease